MQFSSLRMTGFKSFLEPTELNIAEGLTGIVGPNGCGKSNLVEALRWVMGESSAKKMRGGEMDDVIFGGSDKRPPRNLAEVALVIDSSEITTALPAPFNNTEQLEVVRKIERGAGSDYRVNGKSVRAKDVALLFQDHGTGPHSASLVSQGRIGALIAAKPTERRVLIEDAAGITGLHSRRHEAELRLKQAEGNLTRVEDVMGTMETQLNVLKKQARQASRYRNINAELRKQEAMLLHLRWIALERQMADAHEAFRAADKRVGELMLEITKLENARLASSEALPPLRQAEAKAGAILQRLTLAREQIDAEVARVEEARKAAEERHTQAEADRLREADLAEDAARALDDIARETETLKVNAANAETRRTDLLAAAEQALAARHETEERVSTLQKALAMAEAEVTTAERRYQEVLQRRERVKSRREQARREREHLEAAKTSDLFVATAQKEAHDAEEALQTAARDIEAFERRRSAVDGEVNSARQALHEAESLVSGLNTEKKAIERILSAGGGGFAPVLDAVSAQKGYELALAAALGDDLSLPLDETASAFWKGLPAYDTPPRFADGVEILADFVAAPSALARRLALIGVVDDATHAAALAEELLPGQCLVTKDGAAWRWDGICVKAGAPTAAAVRLQQRNRLREIEQELVGAGQKLTEAREGLNTAQAKVSEAAQALREARERHQQTLSLVTKARRAASEAEAALTAQTAKLAAAQETEERIAAECATLDAEVNDVEAAKAALPDLQENRTALAEARALLAEAQAKAADAEAARRQFEHEQNQRQARLGVLTQEKERWLNRCAGADQRRTELAARSREAQEEIARLASRPQELATQRTTLVEQISVAEKERTTTGDRVAEAETALRECEKALKIAENLMGECREARASAQAQVSVTTQAQEDLAERIAEKCECKPHGLRVVAGLAEDDPLPDAEAVEGRIAKIIRERDALGPVNLRAEQEAEEQQAQIDLMLSEREDLIAAIAKLRHGISSLNKEARERLLDAFGKVQEHFKKLFNQLFGGGEAELRLTGADDPLQAGLEIIASPPGKKLQNLTLLSGGEQALTSLALLFAVFLVNPSPICVLDEVDAPLDEANIDRFCSLLDHMVREGSTRFLVITHQRLTMSRMDRLYGVTMMEKGVSKLVSVDLSQAEEIQEGLAA